MKNKKKMPAALKWILRILLVIVCAFAILVVTLSVTEYKPAEREDVSIEGSSSETASLNQEYSIMTWNIGYGALGDNADFFMDGGSHVKTADKERVNENMQGIMDEVNALHPDLALFQEADTNSMRSYHIDETELLRNAFGGESSFAPNFKVLFIPYPIPPIGTVNSGILTLSQFDEASSERIQLPCPFKWPVRLGNLKRCLMVNRIKIDGSDKDLVVINLHLEAYDSGEGKAAQTKMLKEILEKEADEGNYVIAGGDFNQTFEAYDNVYPAQEGKWHAGVIDSSDFEDSLSFHMDASVPTCRSLDQPIAGADLSDFQYYCIDGFIVSNNVMVKSLETQNLGFKNSDHNPVLMKFELK